jgi:Ion channel
LTRSLSTPGATVRRAFYRGLWDGVLVSWPILSALILFKVCLGAFVALLEGWRIGSGVYFAFVTGLTIGYGDLAPVRAISRALAICIGFVGIFLTGLLVALAVRALQTAAQLADRSSWR